MNDFCTVKLPAEFLDLCQIFDTEPNVIIDRFLSLVSGNQDLGLIFDNEATTQVFYHDSVLFNEKEEEQLFRELFSIKMKKSPSESKLIEQWKNRWLAFKRDKQKL